MLGRGVTLVCALVLVVMAGCNGIEVRDTMARQATKAVPTATITTTDRNLRLVGVDFDPPLESQEILRRGSVTLLVAVENDGMQTERQVEVRVRLLAADRPGMQVFRLEDKLVIAGIAAGDVTIVRFEDLSRIPVRPQYRLEVAINPVAGETILSDNERAFDIVFDSTK